MNKLTYLKDLGSEEFKVKIKELLDSYSFAWQFEKHSSYEYNTENNIYQFKHSTIEEGNVICRYIHFFTYLIKLLNEQLGTDVRLLHKIQINLLPVQSYTAEDLEKSWHTDIKFDNYYNLLYFVDDSDGDIVFKTDEGIKSYKPTAGDAILFRSNIEHRATPPTGNNIRRVVNYVFVIDNNTKV
jgi:hypothetical protein